MHAGSRGQTATERWTIRLAPALGVAAIAASALVMTEPEARWARVYVGPTDQPGPLVWRLAVKHGSPNQSLGAECDGDLHASFGPGKTAVTRFHTDADGVAWVTLPRPADASASTIDVQVTEGKRSLAAGPVQVARQRWLTAKRSDGGWCAGFHEGPVDVRLGVIHGIVLHGYPAAVVMALTENNQPLPHQSVLVEAEGAKILAPTEVPQVTVVTDVRGLARLTVRSTDMAATLSVKVPEPHASRFVAALPIHAGGLHVDRKADLLEVSTTIGPTHAWLGLLTEQGLIDVRSLELTAHGDHWSAATGFTNRPKTPIWAVASGEPELESGNTIGWPLLDETSMDEAHSTLVVPNVLALDGKRQVQSRLARQRDRAIATSSFVLLVVATLLAWVMVRSNRRHKRQVNRLEQWLDEEKATSLADKAPIALVAVLVTTAAVVALAFWVAMGLWQ